MTCPKCNGTGFINKQWSLKGETLDTKVSCDCGDVKGIKEDQLDAFIDFIQQRSDETWKKQ
jgi:hypothetical protein